MTNSPLQRVRDAFPQLTDHAYSLIVRAPGRVNLIGEHTDYNDGFVFPCAIDCSTHIAAAPRSDGRVRVFALDFDRASESFVLADSFAQSTANEWMNYVRGSIRVLVDRGSSLVGADLVIAGDIPRGTGLSSSASLSVATITAMLALAGITSVSPSDVALAAQKAENQYVGVQCGIMDQLASARGQAGAALRIDCRSLEVTPATIPDALAVLVVNSGVKRGLVDSAYNDRRRECQRAAAHCGVKALRDVTLAQLQTDGAGLDAVALRRARHVVTENERVIEMVAALKTDDRLAIGNLMAASHTSMRDDFEITHPKVDELVVILQDTIGKDGGTRMTGGGFGGCVVALLPRVRIDEIRKAVNARYQTPDGMAPDSFVFNPSAGAGIVSA